MSASLFRFAASTLDALLDIVFPEVQCYACGEERPLVRGWCRDCAAAAQRGPSLQPPPPLELAVAAHVFTGPARETVHRLKYGGEWHVARHMAHDMLPLLEALSVDALIPVPLHRSRQSSRGYNQAERIASELARLGGPPVLSSALGRVRATVSQTTLSREERLSNLKDAFKARPQRVSGRRIALIDDVFTTGSTLSSCAAALIRAGATGVCAAVYAVAIKDE